MKYINNIHTGITSDIGTMLVIWDLCHWEDYPEESNIPDELRSVQKIHSIEIHVYNKVGVDCSHLLNDKRIKSIIEKEVLDITENYSLEELENETISEHIVIN